MCQNGESSCTNISRRKEEQQQPTTTIQKRCWSPLAFLLVVTRPVMDDKSHRSSPPPLPSFNHLLFLLLEEVPVFFPLLYECCCIFPTPLKVFFSFLFKKTSIRSGVNHETKSRSVLQPQHTKYIQTVDGKLYNNKTKFEKIFDFFFLPRENDVEIPLLLLLLFPIGTPTWSLDGSYRNSAENRVLPLSIGLSFLFVDSTKSNLFVFWL